MFLNKRIPRRRYPHVGPSARPVTCEGGGCGGIGRAATDLDAAAASTPHSTFEIQPSNFDLAQLAHDTLADRELPDGTMPPPSTLNTHPSTK